MLFFLSSLLNGTAWADTENSVGGEWGGGGSDPLFPLWICPGRGLDWDKSLERVKLPVLHMHLEHAGYFINHTG